MPKQEKSRFFSDLIASYIELYKEDLVTYRRHFHRHPEASWQEFKTSAYIKSVLSEYDIEYRSVASTGIIVDIKGHHPGRTLALRGDIDALEVTEETHHDYKSKTKGIMHACGHDGHTAMLLCAAIILNQLKDHLYGSVKLIFQPAEEMVEGAKRIIDEGGLQGVDGILGIHLWSGLETGKISLEAGPRMASGDYIKMAIKGKGGHGSMPHQTVDATYVAASVITQIQSLVSREVNPLESVVLSFGEIRSGSRFNIISGYAELVGTVRCFNPEIRSQLPSIIKRCGEGICKALNASLELHYKKGTPPTINDANLAEFGQKIISQVFDEDTLEAFDKTTGSEDMAYYLEKIPGVMAFVGARNKAKGYDYPHHHPKFNIDEDSLAVGLKLYVSFALSYLFDNRL